jgi:bifunctional non-homologous end joining protein LigD
MIEHVEHKIVPMEPQSGLLHQEKQGYCYQVKWDGFRLLAYGKNKNVYLQGRSLQEKTCLYPELFVLPELVRGNTFLLDGELVAFQEGRPDFYSLMQRERTVACNHIIGKVPVTYMVFDLLLLDGRWLLEEAWEERQALLHKSVVEDGPLHLTPSFEDGAGLLEAVRAKGLEGIVAKKKGSPYIPGPRKSSYWLKTKVEQQLLAFVGGLSFKYEQPSSLLLGLEQGDKKLQYIGSVSSGLGRRELTRWYEWGLQHRSPHPPFSNPPHSSGKKTIWMEPLHQVKVIFNEWTPGLKLRAPRVSGSS